MKKLLALLLITVCFFAANATHLAGGKIWYEYAGNAQNPYRYNVFVQIDRDVSGVPMSLPGDVCVKSSCFSTSTHSAPLLPIYPSFGSDTLPGSRPGSFVAPGQADCFDYTLLGLGGYIVTETYLLHCQIDLPGKCSDFVFSYNDVARNGSSNLAGSGNFHIETRLNNLNGPNSSPKFLNPLSKIFCINTLFQWSQKAEEPDGDSIYYSFDFPANGNCNTNTPATFNNGFSVLNPMRTLSGMHLDASTGLLSFTPSQPEIDVIHIVATEYRFNPSLQQHYLVGASEMDIQISITSRCRKEDGLWLFDSTNTYLSLLCGDTLLRIDSQRKFLKASLSADGSDFALINSKGNLVPIVSASTDSTNNYNLEASSIWLRLYTPISYNDTLTLITRKGSDFNSLINTCANELKINDSVMVITNSCSTWVGESEHLLNPFHLYPNPVTDKLRMSLPQNIMNGKIYVFDLSGKLLLVDDFLGENHPIVELEFLPSSVYIIKATSDQWSQVAKFEKL